MNRLVLTFSTIKAFVVRCHAMLLSQIDEAVADSKFA